MSGIASRRMISRFGLSSIALAAGLLGGTAWAQDAVPPGSPQSPPVQANGEPVKSTDSTIIVTGSRVARSTFDTPQPVTVLNAQDIEKLNLNNVGEVVAQLPANSNFFAPNNVGLGNFNVGAQLVNLRGLNPFFGTRTLTLVDTRRVVPTTTGGGVDVTLMPSMLVARTETVTGGASAVYGSDAIAGVVNIILDTKLQGLKAQADFSRTWHGDGNDRHASVAYGTGFSSDRGHIVAGVEYDKQDAIGICSTSRDWCGRNYSVLTNVGYLTNGDPHYIITGNTYLADTSLTGVLTPCTTKSCVGGTEFQLSPDGKSPIAFNPGAYSYDAGRGAVRVGGDQYAVGPYDATTLRPAVERWTALGHITYELTNALTGFVEFSYAKTKGVNPVANGTIGPSMNQTIPGTWTGTKIAQDNAFLSPAVAALIGPFGATFGRSMVNVENALNQTNNETWRAVAGLNGNIGPRWSWDIYYTHGENNNDQHLHHNVVNTGAGAYLNFALDAVRDPNTGKIVCGVDIVGRINPQTGAPYTATDRTNANLAGSCVPLNLFGIGNADPAAIDYAFRTLDEYNVTKQDVAAVNLRGDLFQGWGAGPVKLAVGGEWRKESVVSTHNLANAPFYNFFTLSYGLDFGGNVQVLEGYGELNVPVFANAPIGKSLVLDLAARYTDDKNTGTLGSNAGSSSSRNFWTWRINGVWDVTDWFRIRVTRSRDVRAPQFRELYQTYAPRVGPPFGFVAANPWAIQYNRDHANDVGFKPVPLGDNLTLLTGGNINLRPETADTWTVGGVISPKTGLLAGFRFSADWYQIQIKDAISGPPFGVGASNIASLCYSGAQAFCSLITFVQPGDPAYNPAFPYDMATVVSTSQNLQAFTSRGVDFEAAYSHPMGNGSISVRALASYMYDQLFNSGAVGQAPINYAGQTGPTGAFGTFNTSPNWQGNLFVTGTQGRFTGTVQVRYIGAGRFETLTPLNAPPVQPGDPGYANTNINSINTNKVAAAAYVNLSASYRLIHGVEVFGSINNLFDKDPPVAPGGNGYPTNPVYFDTYGRVWRVGVRAKI